MILKKMVNLQLWLVLRMKRKMENAIVSQATPKVDDV